MLTVERTVDEVLSAKMRRRGTVRHENVDPAELSARLETFLASKLSGPFAVRDLARLAGGASKEQFSFTLDWERDGERRCDRMVLRKNPPASVVETHRLREFQLLSALQGVVPVPPVYWVATDPEPFGEPALICGFVPGVTGPTKGADRKASGLGTAYGELAPALGAQFVEHLGRIHSFDWRSADLSAFDAPEEGTTQALDWRLAHWDRVWAEDSFEPHPVVTLTRQWLWDRRPPVDRISIVHGDYRNGNFLFDEDRAEITAVLDWELGYLGDRHHDLAYLMLVGWGHDDDRGRYLCSGLLDAESIVALYERSSGLSVDPARLEYYTVLNMYWATVACSATAPRIADDGMTHLDVMMPFVSGLGAFFIGELTKVLTEKG